jgi:hypothetical protein
MRWGGLVGCVGKQRPATTAAVVSDVSESLQQKANPKATKVRICLPPTGLGSIESAQ